MAMVVVKRVVDEIAMREDGLFSLISILSKQLACSEIDSPAKEVW